jgi:nucleotide-binding universal stress UspA family protein
MYKNILVPIVFDEEHDTASAFEVAKVLADEGASFTVMHVLDDLPGYAACHIPAEVMASSRKDIENALASAAEALPNAETVLLSGHAGRQIVGQAATKGADCIVVASHIPGLENLFIGSTADWVVRHAKCAVHVLR